MKFTKDDARKELASKLAPKVKDIAEWDRTINETVENLFVIIGEDNDTLTIEDFSSKALPMLETTAGFVRKQTSDLAKSMNAQIEELKRKVDEGGKGQRQEDENGDERIKLLEQQLNELKSKSELEEANKVIAQKRSEITAKIKSKVVKNDDFIDAYLSKVNIGKDTDVEKEAADFIAMYNKVAANAPEDVTPGAAGGAAPDKTSETVKAAAEIAKSQRIGI